MSVSSAGRRARFSVRGLGLHLQREKKVHSGDRRERRQSPILHAHPRREARGQAGERAPVRAPRRPGAG